MRFFNYILLAGCLSLGLSGCSSDIDDVIVDDIVTDGDYVQVPITLKIGVNHGLQLASRATDEYFDYDAHLPRRLVDWNGAQCIDDLHIYVFYSDTKDGVYRFAGGADTRNGGYHVSSFDNARPVTGDFEEHSYTFTPKLLKGGYYKFLAVGRDDFFGSIEPDTPLGFVPWGTRTLDDLQLELGVTEFHDAYLHNTLGDTQFPYLNTEIFSGIMTYADNEGNVYEDYVHVTGDEVGFERSIVLHRAVAGMYINITDIPAVAVDDETGVSFVPRELLIVMPYTQSVLSLNGKPDLTASNFKVDKRVGYENFGGDEGEFTNSAVYPQWQKSADDKLWLREPFRYKGMNIGRNCVVLSNYLIPFDATKMKSATASTITIRLCSLRSGQQVSYNVNCKIENVVDPITNKIVSYDGDGRNFPILRNCLYSLGTPYQPVSLASAKTKSRAESPTLEMQCKPF